jgi:DNA-binding GntR family transcriptional regulator
MRTATRPGTAAAAGPVVPLRPERPEHKPLADQAADYIRDLIIQDILRPGERIRVQDLARELNISATPLREAFKTLAVERLVDLPPNRGVVVASPSPTELQELFVVYGCLEKLGGSLAAQHATAEELKDIKRLERALMAAYRAGDRLTYFHHNQDLHLTIIHAAHNRPLEEVHRMVNARLHRVRFRGILANARWRETAEQHAAIVAALIARDAERAAGLLLRHLNAAIVGLAADGADEPR